MFNSIKNSILDHKDAVVESARTSNDRTEWMARSITRIDRIYYPRINSYLSLLQISSYKVLKTLYFLFFIITYDISEVLGSFIQIILYFRSAKFILVKWKHTITRNRHHYWQVFKNLTYWLNSILYIKQENR